MVAYLARGAKVSMALGEFDVRLIPGEGPQEVVLNVDPERVEQGLALLAQQEAQGGNGK